MIKKEALSNLFIDYYYQYYLWFFGANQKNGLAILFYTGLFFSSRYKEVHLFFSIFWIIDSVILFHYHVFPKKYDISPGLWIFFNYFFVRDLRHYYLYYTQKEVASRINRILIH